MRVKVCEPEKTVTSDTTPTSFSHLANAGEHHSVPPGI